MSPKELTELKTNALALRNIAGKVLDMVEQAEKNGMALPARTTKRTNRIDLRADLIERIHTGRMKPKSVKK
jgi:hypothetical protein